MSNSGHHDCSTKAVFLCTAIKLRSCHIDGPWASLGRTWPLLVHHRKTLVSVSRVYFCLFPWESFSRHTLFISMCGKTEQISLVRNKDAVRYRLNSDCCMTWQFFCASFGRSFCRGNEHHGIDPNMSNSGHHDNSTKAVFHFLCTAVKLQSCHIDVGTLNIPCLLHLSISIHLSNGFRCSMKFFHLKRALGLALGETWPLLAQPQKNTRDQCLPLPVSVGELF